MENVTDIAQQTVFGIKLVQYGIAFLLILAGFLARLLITASLAKAMSLAERTKYDYDHVLISSLVRPLGAVAVLFGLYLAVRILPLPEEPVDVNRFIVTLIQCAFIAVGTWFGLLLANGVFDVLKEKAKATPSPLDDQLVPVGRNTVKVFLVVIGGVIILQDLGYSVNSLIAGLGIGGMAVALASKDTLANIFGSLVIFIDRPFHVGDWIEMGEIEGTVEEVGLRVTRIRTFANSLITVPNAQMTTTEINNWSRMQKRRIMLTIGLTYRTTPAQIEQAVEKLKQVIREDKNIDQGFYMVNFKDFSAYSLDIFVYCFTTTIVWGEYLQARQELLLKFMDALQELGLDFAFPTQTIHIAGGSKAATEDRPQKQ